jgi:hypothetical protein
MTEKTLETEFGARRLTAPWQWGLRSPAPPPRAITLAALSLANRDLGAKLPVQNAFLREPSLRRISADAPPK